MSPASPRTRRPDADVAPGLLVVDKEPGMTSHDVVALARRALGVRKVGHAGTLDPMATGILVLGVGAATRLLGHLAGNDKTYAATVRLGSTTVTDDREGELLTSTPAGHLTDDDVRAALAAQTGPLQQVPSSVSAVFTAGLALGASFGLLALVPLGPFHQLAFAVSLGIALEILVVRLLVLPAMLTLLGPRAAWPSHRVASRRRAHGPPREDGTGPTTPPSRLSRLSPGRAGSRRSRPDPTPPA